MKLEDPQKELRENKTNRTCKFYRLKDDYCTKLSEECDLFNQKDCALYQKK